MPGDMTITNHSRGINITVLVGALIRRYGDDGTLFKASFGYITEMVAGKNNDPPQCQYGTKAAGNTDRDRCEKAGTETYYMLEDETVALCKEHYDEYHYADYLSGAGDW